MGGYIIQVLKYNNKYLSLGGKLLEAPISDSVITASGDVLMADGKAVEAWPRVKISDSSADISVTYGSTTYTLTDASVTTSDGTMLSSSGNRTNKSVLVKPGTEITVRVCVKKYDSWAPIRNTYIYMNGTSVASVSSDSPYTTYYASHTFTAQKNVKIDLYGMEKHEVAYGSNRYTLYCTAFITEDE